MTSLFPPQTLTCPIAGVQFQKGAGDRLRRLAVGVALALLREDQNRFDPLAVSIWFGGQKLGYVPKAENVPISWALASKKRVRATHAAPTTDGRPQVSITWEDPVEQGVAL